MREARGKSGRKVTHLSFDGRKGGERRLSFIHNCQNRPSSSYFLPMGLTKENLLFCLPLRAREEELLVLCAGHPTTVTTDNR